MDDISIASVYSVLLWSQPRYTHTYYTATLLHILCLTILEPNPKELALRARPQALKL